MSEDPFRRLAPVVRLAPAKLNLTLAVLGRRNDGYHDLHSVALALALADRLSIAPAAGPDDTLHVDGHDAGPTGDNLVLRAIAATRRAVGRGASTIPVSVRLEKRIPVAAGLGGGSSDAAAAVDAALEVWRVPPGLVDRAALAAGLGSDVPFFLAAGAAVLEGRGDRVTPLPNLEGPPPGVLLATPRLAISTALAFGAHEAASLGRGAAATRLTSEHLASEWRAGLSSRGLLDRAGVLAVANDLAPAATTVAPALVPFRRAVTRVLGAPVGQTGSGPTLWALYPSLEAATSAATQLETAVDEGRIPSIGDGRPAIVATTIVSRHEEDSAR